MIVRVCMSLYMLGVVSGATPVAADERAEALVAMLEGVYRTVHDEHSADAPQLTDRRVRVQAPALGSHVLYWQLNSGPEQRVYRQRLLIIEPDADSGLLRQRTVSFVEPARFANQFDQQALFAALTEHDVVSELDAACMPLWRETPAGWRAWLDPARCRIFSSRHQDYRHIEAEVELEPARMRQTERGFDSEGRQLFGTPPGEMLVLERVVASSGWQIEIVAEGLDHPWSIAFLDDARMLVTERAGRLRVIQDGALVAAPVANVPQAFVASQAGLFEVLPAPDFATSGVLYLSMAYGQRRANATRVFRARLQAHALVDVEAIFTAMPRQSTPVHYGGRMLFLPDGTLLVTLGDGFNYREQAQDLGSHFGTIVRINPDGSVPADNPFVARAGALPEIWSYGHRNVQGIVHDPLNDVVYTHEHGPRGGDELNLLLPGRNYGWPVITYGVDYSGALVTPYTERPGMQQPLIDWTPSIAPAGMTLYRGALFPDWQGDLLVASLVGRDVRRIRLHNGEAVEVEALFGEVGARLRDVRTGPDGALYLLTDSSQGQVLRVVPAP
jgi:glucose/arabinose dehydrogenase